MLYLALDIAIFFLYLKEGRAALEAINKTMGLAFDEFDLEVCFLVRLLHNIHGITSVARI